MPERSFGRTVRYRRTKIGLSQAKLGDLVGRSASTVRSWERDASTPTDNEVIDALAAVLAIDPRILYEKARMEVPDIETSPTVEQALASLRPGSQPFDDDDDAPEPTEPSFDLPIQIPVPPLPPLIRPAEPSFVTPRDAIIKTPATPPMAEPSYVEDEGQRQLYRVRNLATLVLMVAFVIVFIWALSNALGALGDWWESFVGGLRI